MMKLELPLLRGCIVATWRHEGRLTGRLRVWCPFCQAYHEHGWPMRKESRKAEHRTATCNCGPLANTGYFVLPWRTSDPESAGHAVRPGKHATKATEKCTCGCQTRKTR